MDDTGGKTGVLSEADLTGFKFVRKVLPMLRCLHGQGCDRDKAHNRTLHFDNYAALVLLCFFNPIVRSVGD